MIVKIQIIAMKKGNVDSFPLVFSINDQTPLKLHFQKRLAVDMHRYEICALPVVGQPDAVKAVVSQPCCDLLKIVVFLLARVEIDIGDTREHQALTLVVISVYISNS